MSSEYMAGYALGVFLVFFAAIVIGVFIRKMSTTDGRTKCSFDERQELVRGKGFKYGFFILLVYNMVICVVAGAYPKVLSFVDAQLQMFIGVALSTVVFACYCIWNEGYFALNEHPKRLLIIFAFVAILNTIIGIINILDNSLFVDGVLTFSCSNIVCATMFYIIFAVLLIKTIRNRREEM